MYFFNVRTLQIPVYIGASEGLVKKVEFPDHPFHGVNGFNGVLHDFGVDLNLQKESAALGLIELTKNHPGEEAQKYLQSLQKIGGNYSEKLARYLYVPSKHDQIDDDTNDTMQIHTYF